MTYPDRQSGSGRRWLGLVILIFLVVYVAFAVEAKARQEVCISAATIDSAGTVTSTPILCS